MTLQLIDKPGVYDLSDDQYHADPSAVPSLSRSVAVEIIERSCLHAWTAHPRLNPDYVPSSPTDESDIGSIVHDIILGGGDKLKVLDFKDWRTNDAKAAREAARAGGKIPILRHKEDKIKRMVDAFHVQLERHEYGAGAFKGQKEKTVLGKEGDTWIRVKPDDFGDEFVDDFKTTGASAEPGAWVKGQLFNMGGDIQAVLYPRVLEALDGKKRHFRFWVQEQEPPFALSCIMLDPAALVEAQEQVEFAINAWDDCMRTGIWPGYTKRIAWAQKPVYLTQKWEAKKDLLVMSGEIEAREKKNEAFDERLLNAG